MKQKTLKNRTIFCRDNLEVLRGINSNSIDLIYLDPPFNKKKQFLAPIGSTSEGAGFEDYFRKRDIKEEWLGLIADVHPMLFEYINGISRIGHKSNKYYLCYMAVRLMEMHRILKDTGSIYLHCDPTMSHFLKLLMDCIFGQNQFKNEIVWCYKSGGSTKRNFSKKHDILLFYSKTNRYYFNYITERSYGKTGGGHGGKVKYFKDEKKGYYSIVGMKNWWNISILATTDPERVGYPTQKPLKLLERIIKASSNTDDMILDPFCGCATTCVASEKLHRQWIGIDISKQAFLLVQKRLTRELENVHPFLNQSHKQKDLGIIYREDIPNRTDITQAKSSKGEIRHFLYGIQEGKCNGCLILFPYVNLTIDHIVPRSKGGGEQKENLQLLCHRCNAIKGDRDMAFLKVRLKEEKALF